MTDFNIQETADPKVIEILDKIGRAIVIIHNDIVKLSEKSSITGKVEIKNFKDVAKYFKALQIRIDQLARAISMVSPSKNEKKIIFLLEQILQELKRA